MERLGIAFITILLALIRSLKTQPRFGEDSIPVPNLFSQA